MKIFRYIVVTLFFAFVCSQQANSQHIDNKVNVVVIDAGHGGKDPGAVGKLIYEKHIALAIALKLGNYIEDNFEDVTVIYTREDDVFVELFKRSEIANRSNADLFISIHVNANEKKHFFGTSTYVMGVNRFQQNLDVVFRENSVIKNEENYEEQYKDFENISSPSFILSSLLQENLYEHSLLFATFIQNHFRERVNRIDQGVKQAALIVLWNSTMPSVLIETGFISNEEEEKYLVSEAGKDYIASSIFHAFRDYKYSVEGQPLFVTVFDSNTNQPSLNVEVDSAMLHTPIVIGGSRTFSSLNEMFSFTKLFNEIIFNKNFNNSNYYGVELFCANFLIPPKYFIFNKYLSIEILKVQNKVKYLVGKTNNFTEIVKLHSKLLNIFPSATIVEFSEGKIVEN